MTNVNIPCPHCGEHFELTEALAAPYIQREREAATGEVKATLAAERKKLESAAAEKARTELKAQMQAELDESKAEVAERDARLKQAQDREREARKAQAEAETLKRELDLQIERAAADARVAATKEATEKATQQAQRDKAQLQNQIAEQATKLQAAETAQEAALKAQREADEAKRTVSLQVEQRLNAELTKARDQAAKEAADQNRQVIQEKDAKLAQLNQRIEELQRAGVSGSQKLQGEVAERDLADQLASAFPDDAIERIKSGQSGADILQKVCTRTGRQIGTILWERKQTKNWSGDWLPKLRTDQRNSSADTCVLVSEALPETVDSFGIVDEVWVSGLGSAVPLAMALRAGLFDSSRANLALAARDTTERHAYHYLTGKDFQARVRQVIEPLVEMQDAHTKEQAAMQRIWNKRDKQLVRMRDGISGMYGDLEGIFGAALPQMEQLALPGEADDEAPKEQRRLNGGAGSAQAANSEACDLV
ncbi:DUF2130 domain-containing protein [bacterium]|nr:DUF2130 domain-containing protein [bacterium]